MLPLQKPLNQPKSKIDFYWKKINFSLSNSLTMADRHKTAGKPNADTTITLVMNHIKSGNPVDSLTL